MSKQIIPWKQVSFLGDEAGPLVNTNGLLWNPDDPGQPAHLEGGQREMRPANLCLRDYLDLGAGRTPAALLAQYVAQPPPGRALPTPRQISGWMRRYAWEQRACRFDELRSQRERAELATRRREMLERGVAQTHERVAELKQAYALLKKYLQREDLVWQVEVKYMRVEDGRYERVENLRFNAALFNQARALLADLARETGGRVLKTEISLPGPEPITYDFSGLSKSELKDLEKSMLEAGLGDVLFP
jgi:hypothetical protein